MKTNTYYVPDEQQILTFMKQYMPNFKSELGYHKWHYVTGFTKNCEYMSDEYKNDVELMSDLHSSVVAFEKKYYADCILPEYDTTKEKIKLSTKKTIFLYWHQGVDNLPDLQQLCFNRLVQTCGKDFNICMLDAATISDYIDIPDVITKAMQNKTMRLQHYVDYIRISLLSKYDAIWLDATIFVRDSLKAVDFNYQFWSTKCKAMYKNTWADKVIPEMNNCQIYAMSGSSYYFYECMKKLIEYHFEKFGIAYSYYMMYYIAQYLYDTNDVIKQQFDYLPYNNEHVECFANNRSLNLDDITKIRHTNTDTHLFKLIKFKTNKDDAYKVYLFLRDVYLNDFDKIKEINNG